MGGRLSEIVFQEHDPRSDGVTLAITGLYLSSVVVVWSDGSRKGGMAGAWRQELPRCTVARPEEQALSPLVALLALWTSCPFCFGAAQSRIDTVCLLRAPPSWALSAGTLLACVFPGR